MNKKKVQACCSITNWRINMATGVGDDTITTISFTSSMVMKARPTEKQLNKMAEKITKLLKLVEVK